MVRIKHRYLLVHILYPTAPSPASAANRSSRTAEEDLPWPVQFHRPTPSGLTSQLLLRTIRNQIQFLYGDWGAGVTSASLAVKYLSLSTSTFIIRVAREHYRLVGAALTWLTELPALPPAPGEDKRGHKQRMECVFRVVRVSGTIRKSEEEALKRARDVVSRLRESGADEGADAEKGLATLGQGGEADEEGSLGGSGEEENDSDDGDEHE